MLKEFLSDKINVMNVTKIALFSFASSSSSQILYDLKHKVHLSKTVCGIFHFRFRLVIIKVYIFVQQKAWTFDFKTP